MCVKERNAISFLFLKLNCCCAILFFCWAICASNCKCISEWMSEWGFAFTKWSDSAVAVAVVKMQCRQANLLSSEVFCCVCVWFSLFYHDCTNFFVWSLVHFIHKVWTLFSSQTYWWCVVDFFRSDIILFILFCSLASCFLLIVFF